MPDQKHHNAILFVCNLAFLQKYMNRIVILVFVAVLYGMSCQVSQPTTNKQESHSIITDSLNLFDNTRNRVVPLALYYIKKPYSRQKIVILNHGYGGRNTGYSAIAKALAGHGYMVVSIQHELPGDAPMPTTGPVYEVRKPFWQRGATTILFAINELKKKWPGLYYDSLVLIGHSNGGDMSMLFAQQHPKLVAKVISLDNRRMPFPRTDHPRIYSLRSSDQPADEGVLPTAEEQAQFHMRIIKLSNTIHNNMGDNGTDEQKQEIISYILEFLNS
jgi:predicted dienelactone hydrolase